MDDVRSELLKRVKDPADVPKFERIYRLIDRRLRKLGDKADIAVTSTVTMQAWREVFGVEWPKTKPAPKGKAARRAAPAGAAQ